MLLYSVQAHTVKTLPSKIQKEYSNVIGMHPYAINLQLRKTNI